MPLPVLVEDRPSAHEAVGEISANALFSSVGYRLLWRQDERASLRLAPPSRRRDCGFVRPRWTICRMSNFADLGLRRIWATVDTRNEKSRKVLERAGFRREDRMSAHRTIRGVPADSYLYAIKQRPGSHRGRTSRDSPHSRVRRQGFVPGDAPPFPAVASAQGGLLHLGHCPSEFPPWTDGGS